MPHESGKMAAGFLLLIAIWVAVYWWWEPRESTRISFADQTSGEMNPADDPSPAPPQPQADHPPIMEPLVHETPEPPPAVIPPEFRDYTIQRGDSLQAISRRFYGTSKHASAIARANPLMDPDKLKLGRVIRIPVDPNNIQGKPGPGSNPPPKTSPAPTPSGPPNAAAATEYTVQSGDTLSGIAKKFYGKASFADFIYEANKDRLSSPDDLREGKPLRIPPKPE